jgi:Golgi nucleoside diphosphatase
MSTPQDQYRDLVQQSQQAIQNAVDTWTKTVQDTVTSLPSNPTQVDPGQVVDQVFDFAERMLEMQRDFTKNLLQNSAAMAQSVARQTQQTAQAAQPTQGV